MVRSSFIAILLLTLLNSLCGVAAADDNAAAADNENAAAPSGTSGMTAPGDSAEVVVLDNTKRRLALIYGLFWLIIAIFVGRIAWMLARARKQLGVTRPHEDPLEAQGGGHLDIAPADDPDNPFRRFQKPDDATDA